MRQIIRVLSLTFFVIGLLSLSSNAQTLGDFRSKSSGSWGANSTWQRYDGSSWIDAAFGETPGGANESNANSVYIEAGHTITLEASHSCKDLHLNTTADVVRLNTQNFTLDVWGKMRFYEGSVPGVSKPVVSTSGVAGWISTGEEGYIRFRGTADRIIMYQGQVNANNTNSGWNMDFAFDPGFTGEIKDRIRIGNVRVSSGILFQNNILGEIRIGTNGGGSDITPNGTLLVKSGATLKGGAGIFKKSNVAAGSITVESGGNLTINVSNYVLAASSLALNGTVTLENAISFPVEGGRSGAAAINAFSDLVLDGSGEKTLAQAISVNGKLSLKGTASLNLNSFGLTYGPSAQLEYNGSSIQTTSGIEFPSSNGPSSLIINNSNGVNLHESRSLSNQLTLTSGLFFLGNNDLTLGENSPAVAGTPSADNMVVTNGTGQLKKIFNAPGTFVYPVGENTDTAQYAPSQITVNSADVLDGSTFLGLRALDGEHPATERVTDKVSRYWQISTNMSGYSYDGLFQYLANDVEGTEANINSFHFSNETTYPLRTQLQTANATLHQLLADDANSVGFISGANYVCAINENVIAGSGVYSYCNTTTDSVFLNGSEALVTSGAPVYQWQKKVNENPWANISVNGTSRHYKDAPLTPGVYKYRRVVKDTLFCAAGEESISNEITLSVNPTITGNTISNFGNEIIHMTFGDLNPFFSTSPDIQVGGGDGVYSYKWFKSYTSGSLHTLIPGAFDEGFGDTTILDRSTYYIREIESGTCSSESNEVAVKVFCSVSTIVNDTACQNTEASFFVTGGGTGLSFQWQVSTNGGSTFQDLTNTYPYSGAVIPVTDPNLKGYKTSTLKIHSVPTYFNGYKFRCKVDGACEEKYSNVATLFVNSLTTIVSQPINKSICGTAGTTFGVTATGALSYRWQLSTDGGTVFNNISNGDIYNNTTASTLTIASTSESMNNYRYRCVVVGACETKISNSATLNVSTPPTIVVNPSNISTCENSDAIISATATGTDLTYMWEVSTNGGATYNSLTNNSTYSGTTSATLTITSVPASYNNHRYRVRIRGCSTVYTMPVTLSVNAGITAHPTNKTLCGSGNTSFIVAASGPDLTYQWQVSTDGGNAFNNITNGGVYSNATTTTLSITGADPSMDNYRYKCIVTGGCSTPVISNPAKLTVGTIPSIISNPTTVNVCENQNVAFSTTTNGGNLSYQWEVSTNGGSIYNFVVDNSIYSGATTPTLSVGSVPASFNNYRYRVRVRGCSTVYSTHANLTVNVGITAHPTNKTLCGTGNTSFTVAAYGPAISYQWQVSTDGGSTFNNVADGGVYSNATTSTLSITGATTSMNGYRYRTVVAGSCALPATSNSALLTVNTAPLVISSTGNLTACENSNVVSYTVSATGSNLLYQWEISTNGGSIYNFVTDGTTYSGATTPTLNITSVQASFNNYYYRCRVRGCATIYSTRAKLTVTSCGARLFSSSLGESSTAQISGYPNPFKHEFSLSYTGFEGVVTIDVKDLEGKTVFTKLSDISDEVIVLGRELPAGIYVVQLYNDKEFKTLKIVKTE